MNDLPDVILADKVRMPKVIQDHGVDINGWHEGNAMFTGVYVESCKVVSMGTEAYIGQYVFTGRALHLPLECEDTTNPRRLDGLDILWEKYLKGVFPNIKRVLDVGSGRGQAGIWFSTAGKEYVGVDVSLGSIGFSIALLPALKYKYSPAYLPEYRQMLAEDLKFADKSFDLVFSCHSLEHMHDLEKAFYEQVRVGRNVCGVIAKPEEEECGEHLYKIEKKDVLDLLTKYCSFYYYDENKAEHVFCGKVK